jgi:meiotically up-regulated gene 157 (Mug157) protein
MDTFVITGDIEAMWLRDSTNQVWPYLRFVNSDVQLKNLIRGVINRQVKSVLIDPYANAFNLDPHSNQGHHDKTEKRPGVFERKYELDSLAAVLRLSAGYPRQFVAR